MKEAKELKDGQETGEGEGAEVWPGDRRRSLPSVLYRELGSPGSGISPCPPLLESGSGRPCSKEESFMIGSLELRALRYHS